MLYMNLFPCVGNVNHPVRGLNYRRIGKLLIRLVLKVQHVAISLVVSRDEDRQLVSVPTTFDVR